MNPFDYHYTCWLPNTLDLDKILQENPIQVKNHKKNPIKIRDRLAYVVNAVCISINSQKRKGKIKNGDQYSPVCTKLLQSVIRDYDCYMKYLVDSGVLIFGEEGKKGKNCSTYQFAKEYCTGKRRKYVILDPVFLNAIFGQNIHNQAIQKYPQQYKNLKHLTVDWPEAYQILDKIYKSNDKEKQRQIDRLKAIEDPRRGTYKLNRTGRLHTTICNLHKDLRATWRFKGPKTAEFDVKNSIPFFSTGLLTQVLFKEKLDKLILEINPKLRDDQGNLHPWLMVVKIASSPESYKDVQEYLKLCQSGRLYTILAAKWSTIPGRMYTRTKAKKKILEIFNSPPSHQSQEKDILQELFPNVLKAFSELNQGYYKTRNGKGKARWQPGDQVCTFAHVTQRFEARIILDVVAKKLEDTGIPVLTLHDCIISIPEHTEIIRKTLIEEITRIMGYPPEISVTDYNKSEE